MPHLQACAKAKQSAREANGKIESESEVPWTVESTCIAFGDNENDVRMLVKAARGCLMGNSTEELKKTLKNDVVVVGTNSEDGVAHEIKKAFKL
ncbi:unnamed protein product [Phytomonas sp. Hart1]|nr:unnamed protein product [Phytomonas sp. Hart1]|eukprot:CCW68566.1 unnamed protein product [Phytomonas sp. isolate Hart1]